MWRIVQYPPVALVVGISCLVAAGLAGSAILKLINGTHPGSSSAHFAALALQVLLTIVAYRLFTRWIECRPNIELARAHATPELCVGLLAGLVLFSLVIGTIALLGGYHIVGLDPALSVSPILAVGFAAGFTEEIIARGLIFRLIEQWLGSWPALAISAALFGAGHLANPHATALAAIAIALEAGVMLAAAYMLTRRLWGAIGLHAGWNMTQGGLYGVPVSGGAMHGLFAERMTGSSLLTGGAFGAEASLPAIVICTAFGILLLAVCRRRDRMVSFLPRRRS